MSKGGERGYRYWEAMKLISGARFPGGLSPWNDGSEDGALRHRLVNGDWHMSGYRVGKKPPTRENVRARYSEFLKIDPDNDTAAGGDFEFVGVKFHPAPPPQPPAKSIAKVRTECYKWLINLMKNPRDRHKDDIMDEALYPGRFPRLTERQFLKAWSEAKAAPTTHESFDKPGPVKGS